MDANRFDALPKRLATGSASRRRLLRGLGAGLLAALGATSTEAAASHLCCTYQCGETLTTSCSRQGNCLPPPVGCTTVDSAYYVKRCSDCAPQASPTTTTTTTIAPTTTAAPTTSTTTTTTTTAAPPTVGCTAGSACQSQCPGSTSSFCVCGTTMAGQPVCYMGGNPCPATSCTRDADCGPGAVCVNQGESFACGTCTAGQGVCSEVCTS